MGIRAPVTERDAVEPSWAWLLSVAIGIASVVAGAILVVKPSNSLATLAVVVGIFLLLDGIIEDRRKSRSARRGVPEDRSGDTEPADPERPPGSASAA